MLLHLQRQHCPKSNTKLRKTRCSSCQLVCLINKREHMDVSCNSISISLFCISTVIISNELFAPTNQTMTSRNFGGPRTISDTSKPWRVTWQRRWNMTWMSRVIILALWLKMYLCFVPSDQEWLDTVNNDRKKEQMDKVSCEAFEIIMDRLEKEWFDLVSLSLSHAFC